MTPQEQQLLSDLFQRLSQTQGAAKDLQAEAQVREGLSAVPDAAYWLAQRTLLLENALQQAQQQITQLQQELAQARQPSASAASAAGSFLSGGLSTHFGRSPEPVPPTAAYAQQAPAVPGWRDRFQGAGLQRPASAPAAPASAAPSGAGSFLGAAAASAAGVAGGMLLFNGLGHWLGGQHEVQPHSNSLADASASTASSSPNPSADHGGMDQMARDAGLDHMDQASSSDWADEGDSFDDDSFA